MNKTIVLMAMLAPSILPIWLPGLYYFYLYVSYGYSFGYSLFWTLFFTSLILFCRGYFTAIKQIDSNWLTVIGNLFVSYQNLISYIAIVFFTLLIFLVAVFTSSQVVFAIGGILIISYTLYNRGKSESLLRMPLAIEVTIAIVWILAIAMPPLWHIFIYTSIYTLMLYVSYSRLDKLKKAYGS